MPIFSCKSFTVAGILLVSVGAVPQSFVWPRDGEEGLERELRVAGVRNVHEIEDTVAFVHSLAKVEGEALMELNGPLDYITAGIRSPKFKVLVAIGLPRGYAVMKCEDNLSTRDAMAQAGPILQIIPCVDHAEFCPRIRDLVGKSDFAMAVFVLAVARMGMGGDTIHKFSQHILIDTPPPSAREIQKVVDLVWMYGLMDMMILVEQARATLGLADRVKTPEEAMQLYVLLWNNLRNIAEPGRAARERRDRRRAEAGLPPMDGGEIHVAVDPLDVHPVVANGRNVEDFRMVAPPPNGSSTTTMMMRISTGQPRSPPTLVDLMIAMTTTTTTTSTTSL